MDILVSTLAAIGLMSLGGIIVILVQIYWMYQNHQYNRRHSCIPVTVTENGETKRGWLMAVATGVYNCTTNTDILPAIALADDPLGQIQPNEWRNPHLVKWEPRDPSLSREKALETVFRPGYPIARFDRPHYL